MPINRIRAPFTLLLAVTVLFGCTVELRSPIKISKPKEEEKESPPPRVVYAPPPATTGAPYPEQPTVIRRQPVEQSQIMSPPAREIPTSTYQAGTSSPDQIVILSSEYLGNTQYSMLGRVSVKDVSENGFSKQEAKEALKLEAFRQFGGQAKGITNVTYDKETSFFGSDRYYEATGEVITWGETAPTQQFETAVPPSGYDETVASRRGPTTALPPDSVEPLEKERTAAYQQPAPERYYPEQEGPSAPEGIASPGNILILSEEDLVGYEFWILGKVSVQSKSEEGFDDKDQANRALRVEAFRQYGSSARGVVSITYEKKRGLLNIKSKKLKGATGSVVTWKGGKAETAGAQQIVKPSPPARETTYAGTTVEPLPTRPAAPPASQAYTPTNILVLSPDDLVTMNFKSLGRIRVTDELENAFDKKSAVKALKVEAFRKHGTQARGITNIDFKRKQGIFNYGKFSEVYADVVTWDSNQTTPYAPEATPAPPALATDLSPPEATATEHLPVLAPESSEEAILPSVPEYTTEIVDSEDIAILDVDELLTPHYKTLGTVTVKAPSRNGYREFEANDALKREALQKFGGKVRALINVEYDKATAYQSTDKVAGATGEAITW